MIVSLFRLRQVIQRRAIQTIRGVLRRRRFRIVCWLFFMKRSHVHTRTSLISMTTCIITSHNSSWWTSRSGRCRCICDRCIICVRLRRNKLKIARLEFRSNLGFGSLKHHLVVHALSQCLAHLLSHFRREHRLDLVFLVVAERLGEELANLVRVHVVAIVEARYDHVEHEQLIKTVLELAKIRLE